MATSLLYLGLCLGPYSILVTAGSGGVCMCSCCSCCGVAGAAIGVAGGAAIGTTCGTAVGIASGIGGVASGIGGGSCGDSCIGWDTVAWGTRGVACSCPLLGFP